MLKSFLLITFIFLINFILNYYYLNLRNKNDEYSEKFTNELMNNSMGTILITFSFLKLLNLNNFTNIFSKYNIISKNFILYAYCYPFLELIIGILLLYKIRFSYLILIILMTVSLISVSISLYKGKNLKCGCLGSYFHLPLSYITIFENIIMLTMSLYQLHLVS